MATLILQDGTVIHAKSFGANCEVFGEIVFNTSMAGYQDILVDPSYANQAVVMTYPEIGNYGINDDVFGSQPALAAFIVKEYCKNESHYKSKKSLGDYLNEKGIVGIEGVDTRSLTKKIRETGTMNCYISAWDLESSQIEQKLEEVKNYKPSRDVVSAVTTKEIYTAGENNPVKIAFIDCGTKPGIVESLANYGCEVKIYPANVNACSILDGGYDALFLSNGPGNPEDCTAQIETLKEIKGKLPIFGISLGCQLLALVSGAKTYKLKYGHHGGNHPVIDLKTNKVIMSSQNHCYAVDENSLGELATITYKNLNDNTLEGFEIKSLKIHALQFCAEADAAGIFENWIELIKTYKENSGKLGA